MDLPKNEQDMTRRELKPEYKYVERIYATYPLLGNAVISDDNMAKINAQAKRCLDMLLETSSTQLPVTAHLFITLATVDYAKKWNSSDESKFTKYVSRQFGYKDDSGRIWNAITKSIEKALMSKHRLFLRDKGGREFYETIIVHSFGPADAWDSIFDLLFDFLKNNLRWNYIKGDPIVKKMVEVIKNRLDGNSEDDEEIIISAMEYKIRLGARRLIQNRPIYVANLFDHMLGRINGLIHNEQPDTKTYSDALIDSWFARKISRMMENDKKQICKVKKISDDIALSYTKIRTTLIMNSGRLWVHIPAIRLETSNVEYAEVKICDGDKIVGYTDLEIYGNELGESVSATDIPLNLVSITDFNITVIIVCDGKEIYNSGKNLWRKIVSFRKSRECNVNSVKTGVYEFYIPYPEKLKLNNIEVLKKSEKYYELRLNDNFSISYDGKIVVMDMANIRETQIIEPVYIANCLMVQDSDKYKVVNSDDFYKIFLDAEKSADSISLIVNGRQFSLGNFRGITEDRMSVYEISLTELAGAGEILDIAILDLESDIILYKRCFYVAGNISFKFNRLYYIQDDDYKNAKLEYKFDGQETLVFFSRNEKIISAAYREGIVEIEIPSIKYEWINLENIYAGDYIWKDDIQADTRLILSNNSVSELTIEFGKYIFRGNNIDLYPVIAKEKADALYNWALTLSVNENKYMIAQIVFSDMFLRTPTFIIENEKLLWDGGINFLGEKKDILSLQLFNQNELRYEFPLVFDQSCIADTTDFVDGEYTFLIIKKNAERDIVLAQDVQFFGNPDKIRFENKTIEINYVTEDVEADSKRIEIKPVYIENIQFIKKDYVPSEDDIFNIYEGQMYFKRYDGSKKYFSSKYYAKNGIQFYQINPVQIIYINDTFLRIINQDEEGLYCYDNLGSSPRFEMTDREPSIGALNYRDVLFYTYNLYKETSRIKQINTIVAQPVQSKKESLFDKFEYVSQEYIIDAPAGARILLNAGPGTGKTWTLIEKIINLVEEKKVNPERILVLCFSKAAVDVIKSRLAEAADLGRVSDVINYVDIRTFDSFASQLLYWVKENNYELLDDHEIERLDYDERIQLFINVIKRVPELIDQCDHLFVDEVQDLVRVRARMVIEMIGCLPVESGVTLLGDSCQSIYDYQVGNDNMDSVQFYKILCERTERFEYYTFKRNFRQDDILASIGDEYRSRILSEKAKNCDNYWNSNIFNVIEKYSPYCAEELDDKDFAPLIEQGTVGILTRTNGQALKISATLRKKGIEHTLRKRLSDNSLNMWIALIFNEMDHMSIDRKEFLDRMYSICISDRNTVYKDIWNALQEIAKTAADHIGIREILHGLLTKAASPLLLSEESKCPVIVTNIHRGKGREFETVLLEDSIFNEKEKTLEEHKVNYVAVTRSKKNIFKISIKNAYMNIDKDGDRRCYEAKSGRNGKRHLANIEVGFRHDVDLRSCVQTEGAQEFIRQNYKDIIGARVRLEKDNHVGEYVIYRIVLVSSDNEIGNTSRQFYDSMVRAIKTIYKLPSGKTPYFKVFPDRICDIYVEDIISVVDRADGSETGVKSFGEMVTWNAVNIVGYGTAEYI